MIRYWIKFDLSNLREIPFGASLGCGVTANNYDDAQNLLEEKVFKTTLPPILEVIENVDISTLDQDHVIPNMKPPIYRGVWYPLGYE